MRSDHRLNSSNDEPIYIDITGILQWIPRRAVGIIRVELALVEHALSSHPEVHFFTIDGSGRGDALAPEQVAKLRLLFDEPSPQSSFDDKLPFISRLRRVWLFVRGSPVGFSKEFDRQAAEFIVGSRKRRGVSYQLAKIAIRIIKKWRQVLVRRPKLRIDPLRRPDTVCLLSTAGLDILAKTPTAAPPVCRLTAFLHDLIPLDFPHLSGVGHPASFARSLDFLFRFAHTIFCVSEDTADRAASVMAQRKITQCPHIVVSRLGSFLKRHQMPDGDVFGLTPGSYAVYCSTIEVRKNHILLLRVWQILAQHLNGALPTLVFVGSWGWQYEEVELFLANNPEVAAKVRILSDVGDPQLSWLYQNARFGLFPSLAEGFGLGAAECLDFGLPVLISDLKSLREATMDLMPTLPPTDVSAWCDAVTKALIDNDWLQALRDRILTDYVRTPPTRFAGVVLTELKAISQPGVLLEQ